MREKKSLFFHKNVDYVQCFLVLVLNKSLRPCFIVKFKRTLKLAGRRRKDKSSFQSSALMFLVYIVLELLGTIILYSRRYIFDC